MYMQTYIEEFATPSLGNLNLATTQKFSVGFSTIVFEVH